MSLRPKKWVLYSPIAVLPFMAALFLQGKALQDDIATRARAALAATGASWAQIEVRGRDVAIKGDSPDGKALEAAIAALMATDGVRLVINQARPAAAGTDQTGSGS
jgi:hypothetical protein